VAPFATAAVGLVVVMLLTAVLPSYYLFLGTSLIVAAINLLGLGVVTGSAGMIALCQMSFAAVGAWVVTQLNYWGAPGDPILWMVIGAVLAGVVGVLVGLPALRLRGVNLAVVTLGFASAVALTLTQLQFPGTAEGMRVPRPTIAFGDREFFVFAAIVLVLCALGVWASKRTRVGSSWLAVAHSERGAASTGASLRGTKLSAFAVSATLGGLSGGLIVMQVGYASPTAFAPLNSLSLYVLAIVIGSYLIDMALLGALLWIALPEIFKQFGVSQDWTSVVFGVLGIQAIASRSNLGEMIRGRLRHRRRPPIAVEATVIGAMETSAADASYRAGRGSEVVLAVQDVSVRFGTVVALDKVGFELRAGEILGLIGPNGAGKSTLVDVITGFLPRHEGEVVLGGRSLGRADPAARARLGLRRTFQQDRVPPGLTVEAYLRFVARRRLSGSEIAEILEFFGCPRMDTPLSIVDIGTRRIVEVAAHVLSGPRVLLLDEPAAGLSHDAHLALGDRLALVPARYGVSLLIIEHDLDLVRRVSDRLVVLDFGRVISQGDQHSVLADPRVIEAYMGDKEAL